MATPQQQSRSSSGTDTQARKHRFGRLLQWAIFQVADYLSPNGQVRRLDEEASLLLTQVNNAAEPRILLIKAMTNVSDRDFRDLEPYTEPYFKHLSATCATFSSELLDLIKDPKITSATGARPSISLVCRVLTAVVQVVTSERAASIVMIGQRLQDDGFLKSQVGATHSAHQLVFALLGWITMLYQPPSEFLAGKLHCSQTDTRRLGMRRPRTWSPEALDVSDELVENTLSNLLVRLSGHPKGPFPSPSSTGSISEPLQSPKLSYYTLAGLAGLQIQWVDSVLEHLELDENSKTLKMFRFPSFCMMLCLSSRGHATFLEKLFSQSMGTDDSPSAPATGPKSGDFFQEVLYTYCLLFGQQKASCKKFKQHQKKGKSLLPEENLDPLLKELCTRAWDEGSTKKLLDFNGVKLSYSVLTDFPFFGERLHILQEYTSNISPNDWKSLWKDRRDLTRFFAVWPALIFGIAALSMGLVQIFLGIAQVVAGFTNTSGQ